MVKRSANIVKRSLEELRAGEKAQQLGRAVLGWIGRWSPGSLHLEGSVRSVMTADVVTCTPVDTLHRAAQIMWERDCGAVPVADSTGRITGIVTDRDLAMGALTQGLPLVAIPVSRVISGQAYSVGVGSSVDEAIALMRARRVRRVLVVDADLKVVGIIALADIARYVAELGPTRHDAALVLADLVATLSERRHDPGSAQRAAE
jgi:CBS domain-containing protein